MHAPSRPYAAGHPRAAPAGFALAALLYAALPNPVETSIFPIPPELLVPPGASP